MNLLKETLEVLKRNNKNQQDVFFCECDGYIPFHKFKVMADVEYDNGFGSQEINSDIKIVGENWWLERAEYDGSEEWHYKEIPTKPKYFSTIESLKYVSLLERR